MKNQLLLTLALFSGLVLVNALAAPAPVSRHATAPTPNEIVAARLESLANHYRNGIDDAVEAAASLTRSTGSSRESLTALADLLDRNAATNRISAERWLTWGYENAQHYFLGMAEGMRLSAALVRPAAPTLQH